MPIRTLVAILLLAAASKAQPASGLKSRTDVPGVNTQSSPPVPGALWIVPAGTRIPLQLRQPVSTKNAQLGDPIYAQTAFPIVIQGQMAIPAGTWETVEPVRKFYAAFALRQA